MIPGIYQGAAAMNALERWQTAITGNLASGSVAGFKKDETSFSAALGGSTKLQPGGLSAEIKRLMPQATSRVSDSQGALRQTGKDLDFAVQGPGYFQVRTPGGGNAYTRNGEFHLDGNGKLVNHQGLEIQGDAGPLNVDINLGPVTVDRTGQLAQGGNTLGKFSVFDLAKSKLQRSGDGLLVPEEGGTPPRVENPDVLQGSVEESNVIPLQEMVNLITVSRAYEVSQKLITSIDQTTRSAIETLGTP
ncbi:MAG: flagellar basal-body rod protein FlgF [Chthoniobacter sp.]|jgi:flagellar basal body rod protein FlgG|nr:flagellar basal-body rod protein FlgF [Chthoniobacter sp.]